MRESTLSYNEALQMAQEFVHDTCEGQDVEIVDIECDCDKYPCPRELGSWSGTTCGVAVVDCKGRNIYEVAYHE